MPRDQRIVKATISAMPTTLSDPLPTVTAIFEDGHTEILFAYYPDEISFTEDEFIGLTNHDAVRLKYHKDLTWLRS